MSLEARGPTRPVSTLQIGMGWITEQPGGLNRYFSELVRVLPSVGVAVTGLVAGSSRVARDTEGVVRAFSPRSAWLPRRLSRARQACARELIALPDALPVTHFALYALPCLDLFGDRPLVVHFHGPWASEARAEGQRPALTKVKMVVERTVLRRASAFITLSQAFAGVLEQDYGVAADRIRVIPGGVDCDRYAIPESSDEARRRLGWPDDRPIVLAVRRLVRRMGLEDLIDATAELRPRVPDVLVHIGGSGPLTDELEARVKALGLEHSVRLLGRIPEPDLPLAYKAATLTVMPSLTLEGFGLVAVESLAAGTPVLVTPIGGLPEILRAVAPELVLPATGVVALAQGLTAALTGAISLPDAERCSDYARARFDWPVVSRQIRDVYTGAMR